MDKGNFVFKPKARLIKTIGEELISNDNVAILELVKNSYDAGSPIVDIRFIGDVKVRTDKSIYLTKEKSSIIIYDEGCGMDFQTIEKAWMEPATNFKKVNKSNNPNRKFTGEKGIGRFAAAKLASHLELVTRREGQDNEIVVNFNWADFSADTYLENIKVDWETRPAQELKSKGTILKLTDLSCEWDEEKIKELRLSLSRLLNPIVPTEDFLISVELPQAFDKALKGTIERPETLNKPDYYIKGAITENGHPGEIVYFSKKTGKEEQIAFSENDFLLEGGRRSIAGSFSFEFRIWNRDDFKSLAAEVNSSVKNVRGDLDDLSGISIYRDNVRVLPYGNKNNDWARLDIRRVNNPTLRLSNNQIIGYISIGLESNPLLKDQSNREGIVEGQAFDDIKSLLKLILNEVEQRRYKERRSDLPGMTGQSASREGLFRQLSIQSLSALVKAECSGNEKIIKAFEEKEQEIQYGITKVQEELARYRRLSSLGQLVDPILHDGGNYLGQIDMQAELIRNLLDKPDCNKEDVRGHVDNIQKSRTGFARLFDRLKPFGGKKRGRPKKILLEDYIEDQFLLYSSKLGKAGISYCISPTKTYVTMDESDLSVIFMNLIVNSIYWLESVPADRKIAVDVKRIATDEIEIVFSDSGPGVKSGFETEIFDPYFSLKEDGIGLGLTIVGETVSEYNGSIALINNGPLEGASFKINLRHRV